MFTVSGLSFLPCHRTNLEQLRQHSSPWLRAVFGCSLLHRATSAFLAVGVLVLSELDRKRRTPQCDCLRESALRQTACARLKQRLRRLVAGNVQRIALTITEVVHDFQWQTTVDLDGLLERARFTPVVSEIRFLHDENIRLIFRF